MDSAIKNSSQTTGALVVMGVAGCGKSSLGAACAERLGWRLIEGDDYHSAEAVAKMRSGTPLTDADRAGWLDRLGALLQAEPGGAVLTCSALRKTYRERLRAAVPGLRFAFLDLPQAVAEARVAARPGHLFPASLVASQFATLERPSGEDGVLDLDATQPITQLVDDIAAWLQAR
ncbi:gluconokinase [Uliginosibacterium sediminicola]|uniref:Gluconokinase n=1 Tax=Uliginosibacterium sediminicola TaxID=2024550 RepID=A0ABU9YYD1_9RHOO